MMTTMTMTEHSEMPTMVTLLSQTLPLPGVCAMETAATEVVLF